MSLIQQKLDAMTLGANGKGLVDWYFLDSL